MEQWEHFPNAPITEAIIDFRATLPPESNLERLLEMQKSIIARYPGKRERNSWQAEFSLDAKGSKFGSVTKPDGFFYLSPDEKQIVQARLDGFTFSRMKPYHSWKEFLAEAKELWGLYEATAKPQQITRIAVRYVNRIELPGATIELDEWLNTYPSTAPGIPQALAAFFMRLVLPWPDVGALAVVNMALDPRRDKPDALPVILDIDVFRESVFTGDFGEVWPLLEKLRDIKNQVFFSSVKPKTKELFR